jgi:hypothetical protein
MCFLTSGRPLSRRNSTLHYLPSSTKSPNPGHRKIHDDPRIPFVHAGKLKNSRKKIGKIRIIGKTRFQWTQKNAKVVVLMNTRWEKFNGRPYGSVRDDMRVTLAKKCNIYINGKAYDALGRPGAVELLFDGNRRIIGLKPIDARRTNAFPVHNHTARYKRIAAAAFCHHFRIKPTSTMLFQNVDIDPEGVMHLDLMNTVTVTRGAR